jgi:ribokinase
MSLDVVVVGGANVDFLVKGAALPSPGGTSVGDELQEAPGGKGANQAIAAARLGSRVAFVGRVGADARGEQVLARLAEEGVDGARVVSDPSAPTGVALIMVDRVGEKAIMTAPGANLRLSPDDVAAAADRIGAARVTLLQLEATVETALAAARLARAAGARVILDAAPPREVPDELVALLDVLRGNAGELEAVTGVRVGDLDTARRAAHVALERGAGAVCVSAPGGDLAVWRGGEQWLPHFAVDVVDATGAGDAFAGALAVALAEGRALVDATRFAAAAAALKTTVLGAQAGLPRRAAVDHFLATAP